jgi:chromosome partitioning protein
MAVISVINQKGGCGKTTTSVNLATGLVKRGYRVLLADMDPQGHSTLGLGFNPDSLRQTVFDVIDAREQDTPLSTVTLEVAGRLTLLPANVFLSAFEQSMSGKAWRESRLAKALFKVKNQYDHIIIDCPPSLGLLTVNALLASTHVIVPVDSGFYSLSGVKKLRETVEMLKSKVHHDLDIKHVITFYDSKSSFNKDFMGDLKKFVGQNNLFKTKIRRSIKFNISQRLGKSVIELGSKRCGVAFRDYYDLTQEVIDWTKSVQNFRISFLRAGNKTAVRSRTVRSVNLAYKGYGRDVRLAGVFNNWQPAPMHKNQDGTWAAAMELDPGQYEYKFVVDGSWITDPDNERVEVKNNIINSVLVVK